VSASQQEHHYIMALRVRVVPTTASGVRVRIVLSGAEAVRSGV